MGIEAWSQYTEQNVCLHINKCCLFVSYDDLTYTIIHTLKLYKNYLLTSGVILSNYNTYVWVTIIPFMSIDTFSGANKKYYNEM